MPDAWAVGVVLIPFFIWRERNSRLFEAIERQPAASFHALLSSIKEISFSFKRPVRNQADLLCARLLHIPILPCPRQVIQEVWWSRPLVGWVKLNSDGCSLGNPGRAGAGGILRDVTAIPIGAFGIFLGISSNILAEFSAVLHGILLAKEKGVTCLWIECDSTAVWMAFQGRSIPWQTFYLLSRPDGSIKLYEFVVILGAFTVVLAQIPSFHSLRHINLLSLILCLTYSICATAASVYIGNSNKGPPKDYSVQGNPDNRIFNAFNGIAIIATAYGNGMIPEIQATIAPPVKGKMFKGLCVCYVVVIITFFGVSISGYWAFGNQAAGTLLTNFFSNGEPLVPKWFLYIINALTFIQVAPVGLVYLQPTNEILERMFADPQKGEFSKRNVVPRLISRSISIAMATLIAAMLPFFGDINGVIGAFGFIPLDFVLPVIFYNITFRPTKLSPIFWLNTFIATVFSVVAVISAVAAVRQITLDAGTYRLFANV
ncbi:GABA transporter 1-like [Telopea speciosissima]|uniref:GABA transporter 1-like n=1 Tax=Telopea speciosissima TaxID=54955 RepID=UPI001CC5721F|nr:GABA transporter 1-like [Telopea speciosissima]